jgi:hypothetical protein
MLPKRLRIADPKAVAKLVLRPPGKAGRIRHAAEQKETPWDIEQGAKISSRTHTMLSYRGTQRAYGDRFQHYAKSR